MSQRSVADYLDLIAEAVGMISCTRRGSVPAGAAGMLVSGDGRQLWGVTQSRPPGAPSLLAQLRGALRLRHYSLRTIEAYVGWVRRYVEFHDLRHPAELAGRDVARFLTWLAESRRVSAATQTQAASALVFLYREVLDLPLGRFDDLVRARQPARVPVVLSGRRWRGCWPSSTARRGWSGACCTAAGSGCWKPSGSG